MTKHENVTCTKPETFVFCALLYPPKSGKYLAPGGKLYVLSELKNK